MLWVISASRLQALSPSLTRPSGETDMQPMLEVSCSCTEVRKQKWHYSA